MSFCSCQLAEGTPPHEARVLAVRGPHREHGMTSMPEGQSNRWMDPSVTVARRRGCDWGHVSRVSRGLSPELVVKPTLLQSASCQAEVRGWKCPTGRRVTAVC